jgi:hypothetical protein
VGFTEIPVLTYPLYPTTNVPSALYQAILFTPDELVDITCDWPRQILATEGVTTPDDGLFETPIYNSYALDTQPLLLQKTYLYAPGLLVGVNVRVPELVVALKPLAKLLQAYTPLSQPVAVIVMVSSKHMSTLLPIPPPLFKSE